MSIQTPASRQGADGVGHGVEAGANVIWIFADQMRHHATGFAGDPNLHTPNLDQMAHLGLSCARGAVSGNALCCPFRGALLTSRWPQRCIPEHEAPMPDGMQTVAHAFNDAGYHTGYFGKWHVDGGTERQGRNAFWIVPPHRRGGFAEWVGYENNNHQYDCWVHGGEGDDAFHRQLEGYETDALTELFIDYLQRRADDGQSFFGALSVQPPHGPMQCPPEYRKLRPDEVQLRPNVPPGGSIADRARDQAPGYYGMIEHLDFNIGRILAALRRLDLSHKTHVIFFADHGEMLGSHGIFGKVTPQEESVRVPFVMYHDNRYSRLRQGTTDVLINHVDIAPTSLGLAGVTPPDWMEGFDYSYVRSGADEPANVPDATMCQAIVHREGSPAYRSVITRDGWKYAATKNGPWLMHNLNDDPYEMANLALVPRHRARRRELHDRLMQCVRDTDDRFEAPVDV